MAKKPTILKKDDKSTKPGKPSDVKFPAKKKKGKKKK